MRFFQAMSIMTLPLLTFAVAASELGNKYGDPPVGWFRVVGAEGYQVGVDKVEKHQGTASAFLKSIPAAKPARWVGLGQLFLAEIYRGKRARMTAYVKCNEVAESAALYMSADSKDKTPLNFDNMQGRPIKGTSDWKKYELVLDVPDESWRIHFGFILLGKGQVWADDFSFEIVGKDVKTTRQLGELPKSTSLAPDVTPLKKGKNLDFEE